MKAIGNRIRKLESRLFTDNGQPQRLWFTILAGCELALDPDRCTEILQECGFRPAGRFGVLDFCGIPNGLNAKELEQYLRRNGAEICGFGGDQKHVGPEGALQLGDTSWSSPAQIGAD
jgi:hypothetical protein